MEIKFLENSEERKQYYNLRWKILREPWLNERDDFVEDDDTSIHLIAKNGDEVVGIARLHYNNEIQAQARFVAVLPEYRGKSLGKKLMGFLERKAQEDGRKEIILHARENAVQFYKQLGYVILEESYLLFGEIQHYLMLKKY